MCVSLIFCFLLLYGFLLLIFLTLCLSLARSLTHSLTLWSVFFLAVKYRKIIFIVERSVWIEIDVHWRIASANVCPANGPTHVVVIVFAAAAAAVVVATDIAFTSNVYTELITVFAQRKHWLSNSKSVFLFCAYDDAISLLLLLLLLFFVDFFFQY